MKRNIKILFAFHFITLFTDMENIEEIVGNETTISKVLIKLGKNPKGGGKKLREKIKSVLIKKGVYNGHAHNKGKTYVKIPNEKFFIKTKKPRNYWNIRQALFKRGLKEKKCEKCGLEKWLGNEIPVEVHHIDGDKLNNELDNLQILCPNCHVFTENYKVKNRKE